MDMLQKEAAKIVGWIEPEAKRNKMLLKTIDEICLLLDKGIGQTAACEKKTVSFAAYYELNECVEIGSVITNPYFRGQGFGSTATTRAIFAAQYNCKGKPIVAMTNSESTRLFLRLGFRPKNKENIFVELQEACESCTEHCLWPDCHCNLLVLNGKLRTYNGIDYGVIALERQNGQDMLQAAELYCEVWKEHPWYEFDWTVENAVKSLTVSDKKDGLCYVAVHKGKVAGFTAGWGIDKNDLDKKTGGALSYLFNDKKIFYIAELGCDMTKRGAKIGYNLSKDLMSQAKALGYDCFVLRTHVDAAPARKLYEKLDFIEQKNVSDSTYPNRTYWIC